MNQDIDIPKDGERMHKIVIVGEKNIGASFMAEAMLKKVFAERKTENVEVVSRGLVVLFEEPVSPIAATILLDNGYDLPRARSRQLTEKDLDADLILTMTPEILDRLKIDFDSLPSTMYIGTFAGYFMESEEEPPRVEETEESYDRIFRIMEPLVETVADRLIAEVFRN